MGHCLPIRGSFLETRLIRNLGRYCFYQIPYTTILPLIFAGLHFTREGKRRTNHLWGTKLWGAILEGFAELGRQFEVTHQRATDKANIPIGKPRT